MVKVSVIVPVYNPGSHIDDCIRSLTGQSLPAEEYEVIFVDDGSTDETPARLDAVAAEHSNVRVEHIPNSGWPGRPRNIGIDMARGAFVYFVDNDDWLGEEALERLYDRAVADDADIVIGKVVGRGKYVPRGLFRENRSGATLENAPLLGLLTPHKLFRRALLDEQGIRFPEGRRRLEDHVFVMHAYFHARSISVLADYPCYHWVLRDRDANASYRAFDPPGYFQNVREVLDLVEEHTEPGPFRDRLLAHWYRGKMLKRVGGAAFVRREPAYNRELYEEIRKLALERYRADSSRRFPFHLRLRAKLLREGTYEQLLALARFEQHLKATVGVRETRRRDGDLVVRVEAAIEGPDGPLRFRRHGARIVWEPPPDLAQALGEEDLDATADLDDSRVQALVRSRDDRSEFVVPVSVQTRLDRRDGALTPVLVADASVDPAGAAGGSALPVGAWDLRAVVELAGFTANAPVRRLQPETGKIFSVVLDVDGEGALRERALPAPPPPPPPPPKPTLRRRIGLRVPWLVRLVRRARGGAADPA